MNSRDNRFGSSWTEDKLRILQGYLDAYTTALKGQRFHLTYVDAFAGNGYVIPNNSNPERGLGALVNGLDEPDKGFIEGSTRRAIEVDDKPFDRLVFIETNPHHVAQLRSLRDEFHDRDIQIEQTDGNEFLRAWCERRNRDLGTPWEGHRAVVFLDPFATEVDWQTIECVAETQSIDLWTLFPVSALTRILPRHREPDENHAAILDRVFGGPEWRNLYQTATVLQGRLLKDGPEDRTVVMREDQQAIVEAYLDKLRTIFPSVASEPKWFRNSRNSPLFAFMFSAANPGRGGQIALRIANHLLDSW